MKKLFAAILIIIPVVTFAKTGSNLDLKGSIEVHAGYGLLSAPDLITGFANIFTTALLPGMTERVDSKGFGTAFGGVDYYLSNRFTLGGQYYFSSFEHHYEMQNESIAILKTRYHTLALRGKGIWVSRQFFQLYSAIAAGPSFVVAENDMNETKQNTEFAFQVSPVGIRAGNHIAFFLEAGFGFQGMISGGLSLRF